MVNNQPYGGLAGKILRVNLSTGKIWTDSVYDYVKKYIGGRTINSYLLLNETRPGARWSDPDNPLIVGTGCLVGTLTPAACRSSIDTINRYNNGKGSANFGGYFGAELKYAGFDHVVITGKSKKPVYLWIHDGKAELCSASTLWGQTTYRTQELIQAELNDKRVRVITIGPAGENEVAGANILGDTAKAAGGSGVGCVMGNKKLKAIAVRGHGSIKPARPSQFMKVATRCLKKITNDPSLITYRNTQFSSKFQPDSPVWDYGTIIRNGQDEWWPLNKRERLFGKNGVQKFRKRVLACNSCPVGCMPFSEINEGNYKGAKGTCYWVNSVWYSQAVDVDEPETSLKWHILANELGVDGDMASVSCAWAFECYEKGLITKSDTDGLELTWGNGKAAVELLDNLANRRGFGDLLADGVYEASKKLGKGSEYFALHVKKQDTIESYRVRRARGLGIVTSACGGRHLRGAQVSKKSFNVSPIEYEGAAKALFYQSRVKEIEDTLGICVFVGPTAGALQPADYKDLLNSAVGLDLTEEEMLEIGRRGYNLEKAFNTIHAGFDRDDDCPPVRFLEEPIRSGPYKGWKADREGYEEMKDEYYKLHGWDIKTGWQTVECLEELGLHDAAEKIAKVNRLP